MATVNQLTIAAAVTGSLNDKPRLVPAVDDIADSVSLCNVNDEHTTIDSRPPSPLEPVRLVEKTLTKSPPTRARASSKSSNSPRSPSSSSSSLTRAPRRKTSRPHSLKSKSSPTPPSPSSSSLSSLTSLSLTPSFIRPRPIPNSYWATPLLLACEYPWTPNISKNSRSNQKSKQKLDLLLQAGVRTFIDLTECGELCSYARTPGVLPLSYSIKENGEVGEEERIEYYNFPIPDRSLPPSLPFLLSILDQISSSISRGRTTAVHCRGGIGRTGLVIGCFLVQSGLCENGEEALKVIAELWKGVEKCRLGRYVCSPETGEQEEFVRRFRRVD